MQTRVYGAIKGSGTRVVRKTADRPIEQGPYGACVIIGAFRSGPTDKVVGMDAGLPQYRRVCGGLMTASQAPLNAEHFYLKGQGAGKLHVLRLTDGTDVQALLPLRSRKVDRSVIETDPMVVTGDIGILKAHNGGRWGGRKREMAGKITSGSVTGASTVDLGFTTSKTSEWVGAKLRFPIDLPGVEYKVIANTSLGVFTIEGTFNSALSSPADGRWNMYLANEHEITGLPEALAVEISDGGEDPSKRFNLAVYRDGDPPRDPWNDMSLDDAGQHYWAARITDDTDNYELAVTDSFSDDPNDALNKPANYAEIIAPGGTIAQNQVRFQVVRWTRAGTGTPFVDTRYDMTWGSDPKPCVITLTFTGSTTYTVRVVMETSGGQVVSMPNGTVGTAYSSQHPWLPGWTVRAGGVSTISGDTLVIYSRPLPANLQKTRGGCYFYPAAAPSEGTVRNRFLVVSNTHDTITLSTGTNLTGLIQEPGAPSITAATAGPFSMTNGLTFIYTAQGRNAVTLTTTLTTSQTAAQVAAHLNTLELARVSGVANDVCVVFAATSANKVSVTSTQDFGLKASLTVGSGTINSVLGFTNSTVATGTDGKIGRLQYRQEMYGGYDGLAALAPANFAAAMDPNSSLLNHLMPLPTGLLKLAMPGMYDATAQVALMEYAYNKGCFACTEFPPDTVDEAAAIAWHEANLKVGSAQDAHAIRFPSYGKIANPYGAGLYTASLTGLIMGLEARMAAINNGLHLAPAGPDYTLSPTVKDLPTKDRTLNNELLTSYGLIEVRKRGAVITLRGDRIPGYQGRLWLHKELAIGHIVQTLLTGLEQLEFNPVNQGTFSRSKLLLEQLFREWWAFGWFSDVDGPDFDKQVLLKVDASNNPNSERVQGNLHIDVSFEIVDTAERVVVTVGPKGVSVAG